MHTFLLIICCFVPRDQYFCKFMITTCTECDLSAYLVDAPFACPWSVVIPGYSSFFHH